MKFDAMYYEPDSLSYPSGQRLKDDFGDLPWIPIQNHSSAKEMQEKPNTESDHMKRNLIVGMRKTHKHAENYRVSDYLVPYTSPGRTAMCLHCCLACSYSKCAYLCLFADREQMLDCIPGRVRTGEQSFTFEIGSNSDLVLEGTITGNLQYTISCFALEGVDKFTFPAKFHMADPTLSLDHREKVISRMNMNPQSVTSRIELGISNPAQRVGAVNCICDHGCPCGLLTVPIILTESWRELYTGLLEELETGLTERMKKQVFLEVILMIYSYVHKVINNEAFLNASDLYDGGMMIGCGRGRYCYRSEVGAGAELFLRAEINRAPNPVPVLYIN